MKKRCLAVAVMMAMTLTACGGSSAAPESKPQEESKTEETQKTEEDLGAAIRYHRGYLYASTRGADRITCFLWENGHLKRMDSVSCGGNSPRDFFLLEDWLICMNEKSSTVTVFKLDENGRLKKIKNTELEIPNVLCGASA